MVKAIIVENDNQYEARCANCGKLLFVYEKLNIPVDKSKQYVKIVSRCTRSDCKVDNFVLV